MKTFKEFLFESKKLTPSQAIDNALQSFEKKYSIKFEPNDAKRLKRHLGKKIHTAPYMNTENKFSYMDKISTREYIDLRELFKDFQEIYEILIKDKYGIVEDFRDDWKIKASKIKGKDFFYLLATHMLNVS